MKTKSTWPGPKSQVVILIGVAICTAISLFGNYLGLRKTTGSHRR